MHQLRQSRQTQPVQLFISEKSGKQNIITYERMFQLINKNVHKHSLLDSIFSFNSIICDAQPL